MSTLNGRNRRTVIAKTANYTVSNADTGVVFTNTSAAGAVTLALPAATVGQRFSMAVTAAQALRADPNGTETISLPSTGVAGAAGKYLGSSTVGSTVNLLCVIAGTWAVESYTGTWAAEA